jgi:hypothetical protein
LTGLIEERKVEPNSELGGAIKYLQKRWTELTHFLRILVEICRSNRVNPFDYMLAVVRNAARAKADPGAWMP